MSFFDKIFHCFRAFCLNGSHLCRVNILTMICSTIIIVIYLFEKVVALITITIEGLLIAKYLRNLEKNGIESIKVV